MKEKARHILCLAFLKSGEKNMEKILIYQVKEKESRRGKKERAHSTIYRQRTTGEPYGILRCE